MCKLSLDLVIACAAGPSAVQTQCISSTASSTYCRLFLHNNDPYNVTIRTVSLAWEHRKREALLKETLERVGGWVDWTEDEEEADREEDGAKGNQTVVVIAHTFLVQMERSSDVPEAVYSGCGAPSWMT